jgi:hypothetical protein
MHTVQEVRSLGTKGSADAEHGSFQPPPLRRLIIAPNQQKERNRASTEKKMLICDVRSRNLYENKEHTDKMSVEKSAIFGKLTTVFEHLRRIGKVFTAYIGGARTILHDHSDH